MIERKIHKQIDRLTDLRIRNGREFFNIKPEIAYEILEDEANTLNDAELGLYKNIKLKKLKNSKSKSYE
jgi:DNA replication protein DnaD